MLDLYTSRLMSAVLVPVWDFFLPTYNCPLKEKVGIVPAEGDNGKWLCGVRTLLQRPGCLVYSFGWDFQSFHLVCLSSRMFILLCIRRP